MIVRPNEPKGGPTVDRRGTSLLVPVGIAAIFVILAVLMIARSGHQDAQPAPPKTATDSSERGR
jgi:hypothetical protein